MNALYPVDARVRYTAELVGRARRVLAYGGLDGIVHRPLFSADGKLFPHFAVKAEGCTIVDSSGQQFIDWVNGWGPNLLGYGRPEILQAIAEHFGCGPSLSLMHPIEVDLAELICELVPCAEMVAFGKNGSDSVNAALRIARASTGKELILQYGFHGFHEWYACLHPQVKGIPSGYRNYVRSFPYNDLTALEKLLDECAGKVAAVIMEPVNMTMPSKGYLEKVRALTKEHKALLIFDEMVTAFRVAKGGAQELFGITPDLACLGKSMGNGMPISAVCGKREYMQYLPSCGFGMTFRGETLSLAAALKTLQIVRDLPVCERLAEVGEIVRKQFHQLCRQREIKCELTGPPARMTFVFQSQNGYSWERLRALFLQECLKRGVITNGNLLTSFSHDEHAIQKTLTVFEQSLDVLKDAISTSLAPREEILGGAVFGPKLIDASGFIDQLNERSGQLEVVGWLLVNDKAAKEIWLKGTNGEQIKAQICGRADLERAFPHIPDAKIAGYKAVLPLTDVADGQSFEFMLVAKLNDRQEYCCYVVVQRLLENMNTRGPFPVNDGVLYV